jgi:predicted nucleic acid-binding protein
VILVDTSVWIDHLRAGDATLIEFLNRCRVLIHPYVIGELALGSLRQREVILAALQNLPSVTVASEDEVMRFIAQQKLFGMGIGYVDAHLLAAVRLTPASSLWTRDKRLANVAENLGLSAMLAH